MEKQEQLLLTKGIYKSFNGIMVLDDVEIEIKYGEVHALMGENGAGKSTLIKIITGVYEKDAGEIFIDGEKVDIRTRADARDNGISVIYQELSLTPALTVTENIFLCQEMKRFGIMKQRDMRAKVLELIEKYEFEISPDAVVETLGMAQRQMVEILKALSMDAKLIIMDEPTSSLSAAESEKLFETIDGLRRKGNAVLYISHRLEEVYRLADRLTVMRDGKIVSVLNKEEINPKTVTMMMIGREPKQARAGVSRELHKENCLEVKNLSYGSLLKDVNFTAYGGEILGIGGLVGSGRTELVRCIYGAAKQSRGEILFNGKPVSKSIAKNIRKGFGFVPEDRHIEGYIPLESIEENIAIASHDMLSRLGIVNDRKGAKWAEKAVEDYDVRPRNKALPVSNLSGGNQQKVILSRWLSRSPKMLLLDEPTVGVDIGVKAELYDFMRSLAERGSIVIMVSSDLQELTSVSDRILVMHDGRFFEEFTHENASQTAILLSASGEHTEEGRAL